MRPFPTISIDDLKTTMKVVQFIVRERDTDIRSWNNLQNIYVLGRKVGKIPTSSLDIDPTDKIGDVNYDQNYYYIVVESGGNAEWRRISLGTW